MINQLPTEIIDIIFKINREDAQKEKYQNIFTYDVLSELCEHSENHIVDSGGGYDILPPSMNKHILNRIKNAQYDPFL